MWVCVCGCVALNFIFDITRKGREEKNGGRGERGGRRGRTRGRGGKREEGNWRIYLEGIFGWGGRGRERGRRRGRGRGRRRGRGRGIGERRRGDRGRRDVALVCFDEFPCSGFLS